MERLIYLIQFLSDSFGAAEAITQKLGCILATKHLKRSHCFDVDDALILGMGELDFSGVKMEAIAWQYTTIEAIAPNGKP
jgi:hypothetical protein